MLHSKQFLVLVALITFLSSSSIHSITAKDAHKIGMLVWKNEANQRVDLLVFWNEHEEFPSLGIGHYIWLPQSIDTRYTQKFPQLCNYLSQQGVELPQWLSQAITIGAPWASRAEFMKDYQRTGELRRLLHANIDLQIQFMLDQLAQQIPLIIQAVPRKQKKQVLRRIELLQATPLGTYALVDYLNFKGDGLNPKEESNGQRWGLLQVLLDMPNKLTKENVTQAFAVAAAKTLVTLIENSAPEYKRVKYLNNWIKRVSTYANEKLFGK